MSSLLFVVFLLSSPNFFFTIAAVVVKPALVYTPSLGSQSSGLGDQMQIAAGLFFLAKLTNRSFFIEACSLLLFFKSPSGLNFTFDNTGSPLGLPKTYLIQKKKHYTAELKQLVQDTHPLLFVDGYVNILRYDEVCAFYSSRLLPPSLNPGQEHDYFFSKQKGILLRELFGAVQEQWPIPRGLIGVHVRTGDKYLRNMSDDGDDRYWLTPQNARFILDCAKQIGPPDFTLYFATDYYPNWEIVGNYTWNHPVPVRHLVDPHFNEAHKTQLYRDFYYLSRAQFVITTGSQLSFSAAAMAATNPLDARTCIKFKCLLCSHTRFEAVLTKLKSMFGRNR